MQKDMDKIIIESRCEAEILQNVVEIAYASGNCTNEEKQVAKKISELLEAMYLSW